MKPKLNHKQSMLLSAFYTMSQEREYVDSPRKIKTRDMLLFEEINGSLGYASDVFRFVINDIDGHYMKEENAEIKRLREKK